MDIISKLSYIKITGPPLLEAIERLEELAKDMPKISKGKISGELLNSGEPVVGDYDFSFEWKIEPTDSDIRKLIFTLDEVFSDLCCRYTITTK